MDSKPTTETKAAGRRGRQLKPRPPAPAYKYMTTATERAIDLCETSEETSGLHRVEPEVWPPPKKRGKTDEEPFLSLRCVYCGSVCLTYGDNDPALSGIEVVPPSRDPAKK